ncbi:unnamed protein product [Tuber aestivum]|uniref:Uncharacterized protein n=1 Tax=Tuber aestivum TaxID=59557 RepID=A0A292PKK2_9PEZI|nr:unnamed protein product [Tuber aestivum]
MITTKRTNQTSSTRSLPPSLWPFRFPSSISTFRPPFPSSFRRMHYSATPEHSRNKIVFRKAKLRGGIQSAPQAIACKYLKHAPGDYANKQAIVRTCRVAPRPSKNPCLIGV